MAPRSLFAGALLGALFLAHPGNAAAVQTVFNSGSPLFANERFQLTDQALWSLAPIHCAHFDFAKDESVSGCSEDRRKVLSGDFWWPSPSVWSMFAELLGGALIETVPLPASCYSSWPEYDSDECKAITSQWTISNLDDSDPAPVMWPLFEGRSCLSTTNASACCTVGGYSSYAVNVTNVAMIQTAVNFARNASLHLVVKNTGHGFNGKSTGAGALGLWTHHLKDIMYIDNYRSSSYQGHAVKMGADVQAFEIYEKAKELGFTAVGPEGKTVGVAGGYVLGGGHSPMSSMYGLAADQVLALEVVLANGRFVTVTEESDPDLFWAIRGGGNTYGVITSVISRVHPKVGVTVSTFSFSTGPNVSVDAFWAGVRLYMERFPAHADAGTYAYFMVISTGANSFLFLMNPFFAVNHTLDEYNALVKPWYDELAALGISIAPKTTYYDNFYDGWMAAFPLDTVASSVMMTGSCLFPRANWKSASLFNSTFDALRSTVTAGYSLLAFNMKAELPDGYTPNSANPAFRKTLLHAITSASWNSATSDAGIRSMMETFTNDVLGKWRATCPDAGAYMSESDILKPKFPQAIYGTNYERLYKLKQRYDPSSLFYTPTGVGSENWVVKSEGGLPDQNGRFCRI